MKNHDIKRVFKLAQRLSSVCIEFSSEGSINYPDPSWKACGKLKDFRLVREEPNKGSHWEGYRFFELFLTIGDREYHAGLFDRFAREFVGFEGEGDDGQHQFLKINGGQNYG